MFNDFKKDFNLVKTLDEGDWGKVILVEQKTDGAYMAVKMISKTKIFNHLKDDEDKKWCAEVIKRERKFLEELSVSIWFTEPKWTMDAQNVVYFGMKYYANGDLFHFQLKHGIFPENVAVFYLVEMITAAVNELHKRCITHRDLKRENFLIDDGGHLVLADFGMALRVSPSKVRKSITGTHVYVSIHY